MFFLRLGKDNDNCGSCLSGKAWLEYTRIRHSHSFRSRISTFRRTFFAPPESFGAFRHKNVGASPERFNPSPTATSGRCRNETRYHNPMSNGVYHFQILTISFYSLTIRFSFPPPASEGSLWKILPENDNRGRGPETSVRSLKSFPSFAVGQFPYPLSLHPSTD
ncbi:hypothetical protein ZHAS_00002112 [Anopheles sinensis]|uniref:Uncharacterized protein n=1 Tax=Anopheles sinensis TaxID=74873 RepID=A0A084VBT0_ANOSI|nr:hypothetical protein ZHAS_00002112 [Anopheles sinensis]